tara:strand:- start:73 stop:372 length:300 start_codon:yes stop_codon:yes gene_type:complete
VLRSRANRPTPKGKKEKQIIPLQEILNNKLFHLMIFCHWFSTSQQQFLLYQLNSALIVLNYLILFVGSFYLPLSFFSSFFRAKKEKCKGGDVKEKNASW